MQVCSSFARTGYELELASIREGVNLSPESSSASSDFFKVFVTKGDEGHRKALRLLSSVINVIRHGFF